MPGNLGKLFKVKQLRPPRYGRIGDSRDRQACCPRFARAPTRRGQDVAVSAARDASSLLRVAVLILGAGVLGFSLRLGLLGRMFLVLVLFVSHRLRVLRLGRRRGLIRLGGGRRVGGGRLRERRRQGSEGGHDRRDNERF